MGGAFATCRCGQEYEFRLQKLKNWTFLARMEGWTVIGGVRLPLDLLAEVLRRVPAGDRLALVCVSRDFETCCLSRVFPPWEHGARGLMHAVEMGHFEYFARFFKMAGRRVQWTADWEDNGPLRWACILNRPDVVHWLLKDGSDPSVRDGKMRSNSFLPHIGCSVDSCIGEPFRRACEYGHELVLRMLLTDVPRLRLTQSQEEYAVRAACRNGHDGILRILQDARVLKWDKALQGWTKTSSPSFLRLCARDAAYFGHPNVLRFMMKIIQPPLATDEDQTENTCGPSLSSSGIFSLCIEEFLEAAITAKSVECVGLLLQKLPSSVRGKSDFEILQNMREKAKKHPEIKELIEEEMEDREVDQGVVVEDYPCQDEGHLPLFIGQLVLIKSQEEEEWWYGQEITTGREGKFPARVVEIV